MCKEPLSKQPYRRLRKDGGEKRKEIVLVKCDISKCRGVVEDEFPLCNQRGTF